MDVYFESGVHVLERVDADNRVSVRLEVSEGAGERIDTRNCVAVCVDVAVGGVSSIASGFRRRFAVRVSMR